jgi:hypothetical protein
MDTLKLEISETSIWGWDRVSSRVNIFINDMPLPDIMEAVEKTHFQDGRMSRYSGIQLVRAMGEFLLPEENADDEGRVAVGGCGCGEVECWPLEARITLEGDRVIWEDFYNPVMEWKHEGIRFVFARKQYDAEVLKCRQKYDEEHPKK